MSKLSLAIQAACNPSLKLQESKWKEKKELKKTKPNPIGKKKKLRLSLEWSESELFIKRFRQLQDRNENYCMVTWKLITEDMLSPACFPHILPKSKYPHLRHFLNNIWLVLWIKEHQEFDRIVNEVKRKIWHIEFEQIIMWWKEIRFPTLESVINSESYKNVWLKPDLIILDDFMN